MTTSTFHELLGSLETEYEKAQSQIATLTAQVGQLSAENETGSKTQLLNSGIAPKTTDGTPVSPSATTPRAAPLRLPCHATRLATAFECDPLVQSRGDNGWPECECLSIVSGAGSRVGSEISTAARAPKGDVSQQASMRDSVASARVYEVLKAWQDTGPIPRGRTSFHYYERDRSQVRVGEEMTGGGLGCLQKRVSRPGSLRCVLWDVSSFLVMAYDCIMLPLQPFDLQATKFTIRMSYVITIFWTCDILLSFSRGYHSGVSVEMRPSKIARRYIRSWFSLDALIAAFDWFFILSESGGLTDFFGLARTMKALRILRVMRMLRLSRILKVLSLLEELSAYIHSEATWTALSILKLIVMIVFVNHFLACGWYAVGIVDTGRNTWVIQLEDADDYTASFGWLYSSALHWSITQFTPASMEIVPCNVYERIYAICVILFALVTFSSFVSSITSAMTHIRAVQFEEEKQENQVHKYIAENYVSMELGKRILVFLREYRRAFKTRVHEGDIPILGVLPESARLQLHAQIFSPVLTTHPLFDRLSDESDSCLAMICHKTISELTLMWGQELCSPGQPASRMYFIVTGTIGQSDSTDANDLPTLRNGDYLCEMALWVDWVHQDLMVSKVNSEVVTLSSSALQEIAPQLETLVPLRSYAHLYTKRLNAANSARGIVAVRISDTWGSGDAARLTTYGFAQKAFDDWSAETSGTGDESLAVKRQTSMTIKGQSSMTIKKMLPRAFSNVSSASNTSSQRNGDDSPRRHKHGK